MWFSHGALWVLISELDLHYFSELSLVSSLEYCVTGGMVRQLSPGCEERLGSSISKSWTRLLGIFQI